MKKPKIAVSIGDINGVGVEIALKSHKAISKFCTPYYFIHETLLNEALRKLKLKKPKNFRALSFKNAKKAEFQKKNLTFSANLGFEVNEKFSIRAGEIDKDSGLYSFLSFKAACEFVKCGFAKALITLPIHKKAWSEAGLSYHGHTEALRDFFGREAIMMLGCKKLFVALFTEHIPLSEVRSRIEIPKLCEFFFTFYKQTRFKNIGVLAFNPHASDFGTIGGEEEDKIIKAIRLANLILSFENSPKHLQKGFLKENDIKAMSLFENLYNDENLAITLEKAVKFKHFYNPNPLVADAAFTPNALKCCNRLVSMSHDIGLAPLKALYFDESINVSLNLPIIRTSVDHGTAFDKAYTNAKISTKSYKEAVKMALHFAKQNARLESFNFNCLNKN